MTDLGLSRVGPIERFYRDAEPNGQADCGPIRSDESRDRWAFGACGSLLALAESAFQATLPLCFRSDMRFDAPPARQAELLGRSGLFSLLRFPFFLAEQPLGGNVEGRRDEECDQRRHQETANHRGAH